MGVEFKLGQNKSVPVFDLDAGNLNADCFRHVEFDGAEFDGTTSLPTFNLLVRGNRPDVSTFSDWRYSLVVLGANGFNGRTGAKFAAIGTLGELGDLGSDGMRRMPFTGVYCINGQPPLSGPSRSVNGKISAYNIMDRNFTNVIGGVNVL